LKKEQQPKLDARGFGVCFLCQLTCLVLQKSRRIKLPKSEKEEGAVPTMGVLPYTK
jgi:hypothetical protein